MPEQLFVPYSPAYAEFPIGTRIRVKLPRGRREGRYGDYYEGDTGVVVAPREGDDGRYPDGVRVDFDHSPVARNVTRDRYVVHMAEMERETPEWGQEPGLV